MKPVVRVFALTLILSMVLTLGSAASPSTLAPTRMAEAAAAANSVVIQNFAFAPQVLNIKVGDTVTWQNNDSVGHTATSTSGAFDSKTLERGQTFSFTFTKAGKYDYSCAIHPMMTGTIVVAAAGAAPAAMTPMNTAQAATMAMTGTFATTMAVAEPNHVSIQNYAFNPAVLTVTVGMSVTWTNLDPVGHTATSTNTDEPFESGTLLTGEISSYTFTKAGKFDYICEVHPNMQGTIVVVEAGAAPAQPAATGK